MLKKRINEIEEMVLEDDALLNFYQCNSCKKKFKTKVDWFDLQGCPKCRTSDINVKSHRQSLFDIEMCIESNKDYMAFFTRYHNKISKFDIERRLNAIKQWVMNIVREKSSKRRFKRFR